MRWRRLAASKSVQARSLQLTRMRHLELRDGEGIEQEKPGGRGENASPAVGACCTGVVRAHPGCLRSRDHRPACWPPVPSTRRPSTTTFRREQSTVRGSWLAATSLHSDIPSATPPRRLVFHRALLGDYCKNYGLIRVHSGTEWEDWRAPTSAPTAGVTLSGLSRLRSPFRDDGQRSG